MGALRISGASQLGGGIGGLMRPLPASKICARATAKSWGRRAFSMRLGERLMSGISVSGRRSDVRLSGEVLSSDAWKRSS